MGTRLALTTHRGIMKISVYAEDRSSDLIKDLIVKKSLVTQ